jgi:AcrR family transcriptional regulator
MAVADRDGLGSLTIRSLAQELGVKPMSVYHYVKNKDQILDNIVDLVFDEIELPSPGADWRIEMRRRAGSARQALSRHPWAIALLQSRVNPGPATLRHHNAVLGTLRSAGFSIELTAHAFALIDSYVFGFALSETTLPISGPDTIVEVAESMMPREAAELYPYLIEFTTEHVLKPGYDFRAEFDFGLDAVLNALEAAVHAPLVLTTYACVRREHLRSAPATRWPR